jgi:D-beta-D-heptose 7-phosphate kinase/D-beta-D-heptose 1-phosphate adenosyltransferase
MQELPKLNHKIKGEAELLTELSARRARGERLVFTNGCFDILHYGHVFLLSNAADEGDVLVVGLNSDASVRRLKGDGRPVNDQAHRAVVIAALEMVTYVTIFDEDTPERLIDVLQPDVLVKGGDWRPDQIAGAQTVIDRGGKVVIFPYQKGFSTTQIIAGAKSTQA